MTSKEEINIITNLLPKLSQRISEDMQEWQLSPKIFSKEIFSLANKNFPQYSKKHYTGEILSIDTEPVEHAILNGIIPIFSSLAFDENENPYNINADEMAVHIAVSMKAKKLIFFSDVQGVLDLDKKLISTIQLKRIEELESSGIISGGMIPKLEACKTAIEGGVDRCHIVSGLEDGATLKEIFTVEGIGTMILDEITQYRHIRQARKGDTAVLHFLAEENQVLENFSSIHDFLVFEIDGQIIGYIKKNSPTEKFSSPVVRKKFSNLNIQTLLEQKRDQEAMEKFIF